MDLSIIILNYNTKELTRRCLRSVFASQTSFKYEVWVSDNGSKDGSIEMIKAEFPGVKLLENNGNLGFAKGNNIAIRQATGRYILLLNSDTEVKPDSSDLCVKRADADRSIGALGCKVLLSDGSLDKACRRNFPNPWNSFLRLFGFRKFSNYNIQAPLDQEIEVDALTGAFMMVRREAIDKAGMLDEEFFMYGEDLDWCWRIKEVGYKIIYYPGTSILHLKSASSKRVAFRVVKWAHDAMKIFYRKHYAQGHNFLFNQIVYMGITIRMYMVWILNLLRNKKTVH